MSSAHQSPDARQTPQGPWDRETSTPAYAREPPTFVAGPAAGARARARSRRSLYRNAERRRGRLPMLCSAGRTRARPPCPPGVLRLMAFGTYHTTLHYCRHTRLRACVLEPLRNTLLVHDTGHWQSALALSRVQTHMLLQLQLTTIIKHPHDPDSPSTRTEHDDKTTTPLFF
jgi:hypothetical protein